MKQKQNEVKTVDELVEEFFSSDVEKAFSQVEVEVEEMGMGFKFSSLSLKVEDLQLFAQARDIALTFTIVMGPLMVWIIAKLAGWV